jgi:hypothetical protein
MLRLRVRRSVFSDGPEDQTAHVGETWSITGGSGRLARLRGSGTMDELVQFGEGRNELGGLTEGHVQQT